MNTFGVPNPITPNIGYIQKQRHVTIQYLSGQNINDWPQEASKKGR
jgi:hypothetical protein